VRRLRIAVVVPFLDEEDHLPALLESLAGQERPADELLLVDDGSRDGSVAIARTFAAQHACRRLLLRGRPPAPGNGLEQAQDWRAFATGVARLREPWDVVAKLDADLRLAPDLLAQAEHAFLGDPSLGIAGPALSERRRGRLEPLRTAPGHVDGAARFYRRACLEDVSPVPPLLGWDTIDEVRARMRGWETRRFPAVAEHCRRMGTRDGVVRGYARAGRAAYAYGADPLYVLASALTRLRDHPAGACGIAYLAGFAASAVRSGPRAEPEARARVREEQRARLTERARGRAA
jgi:glycosyltransferase involved in cell wall biosynthesis